MIACYGVVVHNLGGDAKQADEHSSAEPGFFHPNEGSGTHVQTQQEYFQNTNNSLKRHVAEPTKKGVLLG
jgi:homoserine acetyltransferase